MGLIKRKLRAESPKLGVEITLGFFLWEDLGGDES